MRAKLHSIRRALTVCLVMTLVLSAAGILAAQADPKPATPEKPPAQEPPAREPGAGKPGEETKSDPKSGEEKKRDGAGTRAVDLNPVIVTATRGEKNRFDLPYMADVLDNEDLLNRRMARSTPEALRETTGVMVQRTAHGQGSPYMRGFTGFRTLFLIEGIRLNNSVFRDGPNQYWNTVDPYSLDKLEVVRGPGSALYGSDAIGGTVHAFTRTRREHAPGFQANGRVYYRYSTAEHSHTVRTEASGDVDERFSYVVGFTGKDYGDLRGGHKVGEQDKTGYHEWAADIKLEYRLNEDARLVGGYQKVDQDDAWRAHKTIYGVNWEGTTNGSELKRAFDHDRYLVYVQFHEENRESFIDTIRANVSYHVQDELRDRTRSDGRIDHQGMTVGTIGTWFQLESETEAGRFTFGADFYFDNVNSFRNNYNPDGSLGSSAIQGPVADDSRYYMTGVFMQDEIAVTDRFDVIVGGRYTWVKAVAHQMQDPVTGQPTSLKDYFNQGTASIRGIFRLDEDERWAVFGGASQGFRAPNLSDLTRLDSARSNEIEIPSPGLDPEHFTTFEVGAKSSHDNFYGEVSAYYTVIRDMIIRRPNGQVIGGDNVVVKENAGDGYVWGIEATVRYRFTEQWSAFANFAWMDSSVRTYPTSAPDSEREPISREMPAMGNVGVRWNTEKRDIWVEGLLNFAEKASDLSTRDKSDTQRIPPGGTPGYTIFTVRGGWQVNDYLTVSAALENLLNSDYRIHGSGVNEAGLNGVISADVNF